jgi:hypothetical protein
LYPKFVFKGAEMIEMPDLIEVVLYEDSLIKVIRQSGCQGEVYVQHKEGERVAVKVSAYPGDVTSKPCLEVQHPAKAAVTRDRETGDLRVE